MASQSSDKPYTLKEFEEELKEIRLFSIRSFAKVKETLQKKETDAVKIEAKALKQEIEQKGNRGLCEEGATFLNYLIEQGCLLQPDLMDPKTNTTVAHVENPAADNKAQVHQSASKDQERVDEMSQPGKGQQFAGSKTVIATSGQLSDPGSQPSMSATVHGTSPTRTHEVIAASGDKDKSEEVIRLINKCLVSEAPCVPDPKQHPRLELIIKHINSLKDDKKKQTQINEAHNTMVKSLEEKIKSLEEKRKEQIETMNDMERKYNEHFHQLVDENTKLKSSNEQLEVSLKHTRAEQHQVQSYAQEMQSNASKLDQRLRKSREEVEGLKQQIAQQAEDNARQKQKLSEEMHRIHSENKQLKSRVSELAGAKLMDNNPDIADLSDPNRAMKLGEKFSSLYDDDWTDTFQTLTEKFKMTDEEAIQQLLEILLRTYEFCRKVGDEQMDILCNIFENPCQDIPKVLTMKPQRDKLQMTQKHHKELKDLRKKIALKQVDSISKQYLAKENEEAKKGDKKLKQMFDETRGYYEKCVEVCWPMVLHDPPVRMEMKVQPGIRIDPNRYRLYGGNGDTLEYLVWPPLLVEGGGLIAKGVAKPKKVTRTVKKP